MSLGEDWERLKKKCVVGEKIEGEGGGEGEGDEDIKKFGVWSWYFTLRGKVKETKI